VLILIEFNEMFSRKKTLLSDVATPKQEVEYKIGKNVYEGMNEDEE